jgi:hypothetical protein
VRFAVACVSVLHVSALLSNRCSLPLTCRATLLAQHDVHAAAGAVEAEKSALKAIVGKYNVSEEDVQGKLG